MQIIYEDGSILVVLKPSGQVVNRAETTRGVQTLQDELEERFEIKKSEEGIGGRAGIVHRLDKETSGVLVVAKTEKAFVDLQAQFKQRKVKKEYLALAHGEIKQRQGIIRAPLGRNPKNRRRFAVVEGGRHATTEYHLIHTILYRACGTSKIASDRGSRPISYEYKEEKREFSYLRVKLLTGRTHQIRVHMKYIGHPIVSDPLYLSRRWLKEDRKWCPRTFLHAESLGFKHPKSGAWVRFEADLPEDLQGALAAVSN